MKKLITLAGFAALLSATSAFAMDDMSSDKMSMMVDAKMKMMDTNGDGMVSRAEFDAAGDKMFKDMDKKGDGMITKEGMMEGMKKEHAMMMNKDGMMKDGMSKDGMMENK